MLARLVLLAARTSTLQKRVPWVSGSSLIFDGDEQVAGIGGQRLYIVVSTQAAIPQILRTLNMRARLLGIGSQNVTGALVVVGPRLSSISIVVEGCGHVGEGGVGGQRRRAAARCPPTPPVRRQAHRPYVHSPAVRVAPGPRLRFESANRLVIGVQLFWHRLCASCQGPSPWPARSAIPARGVEACEAVPCFHRLRESSRPVGPSIRSRW